MQLLPKLECLKNFTVQQKEKRTKSGPTFDFSFYAAKIESGHCLTRPIDSTEHLIGQLDRMIDEAVAQSRRADHTENCSEVPKKRSNFGQRPQWSHLKLSEY